MKTLITAASDSFAYKIARLLGEKDIIYGSETKIPSFNNLQFILIPSLESNSYSHELLKICLDYNINEIFPLKKSEILELSSTKLIFEEYDIQIRIPNFISTKVELLNNNLNLLNYTILADGLVVAGDQFPNKDIAKELVNGVFKWGMENGEFVIRLFFI